ncbi:polysaccharide deacetylase family protein [Vibrio fluminensis]|uniref:polysaccharide deacetylase family protein n=1 Tax=Vibrio fluminensis TaxID=2783614 RepID=UPI001E3BAE1D|nr:polysaccharide deacetylase family protein [Vibrio fluminensis]
MLSEQGLVWLRRLLVERFGVDIHLTSNDGKYILYLPDCGKRIIIDYIQNEFYDLNSKLSCYLWDADKENFEGYTDNVIPAPGNRVISYPLINIENETLTINYDILGLAYWMLNRIEEIGSEELDAHQRFPATSSHAYKFGYLERPIVDEWLGILQQAIKKICPNLEFRKNEFLIQVSHDVDVPSEFGFSSWKKVIKGMIRNGVSLQLSKMIKVPVTKLLTKKNLLISDPCNTFSWLMDASDDIRVNSSFYFMAGKTNDNYDSDYKLDCKPIESLMLQIHRRGHYIGIHPSYETFNDFPAFLSEYQKLREVCDRLGITQVEWGGRMHYLRWSHPQTLRAFEDSGINYDSTLGYADLPGFRCGTCFEYTAFDPINHKIMKLRLRPLIVMECTILRTLGVSEEAKVKMLYLKNQCRKVSGTFSILWHNSQFDTHDHKRLYLDVIEYDK